MNCAGLQVSEHKAKLMLSTIGFLIWPCVRAYKDVVDCRCSDLDYYAMVLSYRMCTELSYIHNDQKTRSPRCL